MKTIHNRFYSKVRPWALSIGFLLLWIPTQAIALLDIGVTAKGGTTGIGGDLTVPIISNWVNFRAGYNWLEFRTSVEQSGIRYKGEVGLNNALILIDFHPFHGNFRITGGVYYNDNSFDLSSIVGAGTVVGNTPLVGTTTLNANVDWSSEFAPYFGIGWGNAADDNTLDLPVALGFSLDIGAFYQGSPDVTLTDSAGIVLPADLNAERAQIEQDVKDFKFFPVFTLGIHLRF